MTALLLAPTVLGFLLLAAHFSRAGQPWLVGLSLALVALIFVRRRWSAWILQISLALATLEWWRTAWVLAGARREAGLPSARLIIILLSVSAVSAVALLVWRRSRLRWLFGASS